MTSALIGHTGFVGSNLAAQLEFDEFYNSKNIEEMRGREYDLVVCAGAPGWKWYANNYPQEDFKSICRLFDTLDDVFCHRFVLISTIDVIYDQGRPYGDNRALLEEFAGLTFGSCHIIRLPGLFGPGLKKNALFDLVHRHQVHAVAPNAVYQWYPTKLLGRLVLDCLAQSFHNVTVSTAPVSMEEIRREFFPDVKIGLPIAAPPNYTAGGTRRFHLSRQKVFEYLGEWLHECQLNIPRQAALASI